MQNKRCFVRLKYVFEKATYEANVCSHYPYKDYVKIVFKKFILLILVLFSTMLRPAKHLTASNALVVGGSVFVGFVTIKAVNQWYACYKRKHDSKLSKGLKKQVGTNLDQHDSDGKTPLGLPGVIPRGIRPSSSARTRGIRPLLSGVHASFGQYDGYGHTLFDAAMESTGSQCDSIFSREVDALDRATVLQSSARLSRDGAKGIRMVPSGVHANPEYNNFGETALTDAIRKQDEDQIRRLVQSDRSVDINQANKKGYIPLEIATRFGNVKFVNLLLAGGADINLIGKDGTTVLWQAIGLSDLKMAQALIAGNADLNQHNDNGQTPLLRAFGIQHKKKRLDMVKLLVEKQVNITQCSNGICPLKWAICEDKDLELIRELLKNSGSVNQKAESGFFPIEYALNSSFSVFHLLITKGAKFSDCTFVRSDGTAGYNSRFPIFYRWYLSEVKKNRSQAMMIEFENKVFAKKHQITFIPSPTINGSSRISSVSGAVKCPLPKELGRGDERQPAYEVVLEAWRKNKEMEEASVDSK